MRKSFWLGSVGAALMLAACATPSAGAPTLAAAPLPGMTAVEATLDEDELAADAPDPAAVRRALQDAGFRAATERTYAGGGGAFPRVVVRLLALGGEQGATSFLDWLRTDGGTALFTGVPSALEVPSGVVVLLHEPDGCCPREAPVYLAAWQRGTDVVTVKASGREGTDRAMQDLVETLWEEIS
ncbi:MAG: hypothetical protein WD096_05065 [Actinomycetota bacterium]